jgi:glycosyltransferase involved in cell wall biosynthesis
LPPAYSIVIPAYNESERIRSTLDKILVHIQEQGWNAEILVVNDGSTDATAQIVQAYAAQYPSLHLIQNPGNHGK